MKSLTAKQMQRIEKKQKKMAAFLEIAKLNDKDRKARSVVKHCQEENVLSYPEKDQSMNSSEGPRRKRHKKESDPPTGLLTIAADQNISPEEPANMQKQKTEDPVRTLPKEEDTLTGKPKLHGEEFQRLKRKLRERNNRLKYLPRIRLREAGERASFSVSEDTRSPLFLSDIQHLLMFSTFGQQSPYFPGRWCHLQKHSHLSHIVVLVVDEFSAYDFLSHESLFPEMTRIFENKLEIITPNSYDGNIVEVLMSVPMLDYQREKLIKEFGSLQAASMSQDSFHKELRAIFPIKESSKDEHDLLPSSDRFSRVHLLLSPAQMVDDNYPLPLKGELLGRYSGYIPTKDIYEEVKSTSPMFGLDCEMCRTSIGESELTRVSVVDEQLKVVYETLVKPYNRITDYLTRFSGITKQLLKNVTVRLEQVQEDLRSLLPPDAILIGQSLNFDLQALKMFHPYVIDTSVIYNITGDRFRKTKLSVLSEKYLGEEIQIGNDGHCSVEDSVAAMKLTQLKLANNIEFGDVSLTTMTELNKRKTELTKSCGCSLSSVFSTEKNAGKSAVVVGSSQVMDKYSTYLSKNFTNPIKSCPQGCNKIPIRCVPEESSKNVIKKTCEVALGHSFTIGHVYHSPKDSPCENGTVYHKLDSWCKKVWDHIALNGMYIVLLGGKKSGANGAAFIQIKKPIEQNLLSEEI